MLPPPDGEAMMAVRRRNATLAKPVGALGQLEEIAEWVAGWQGNAKPGITRPLLAVFAGTHGLVPGRDDTADVVATFAAGGAAANQICAVNDVGLKVFELALQMPTRDIRSGAALEERDCAATIAFGMEAIAGGADLVCIGTIGQGSDISAAAMLAALHGGRPQDWGADAASAACAEAALHFNDGALDDPLEVLRRLGGRECAAAVGAILAARIQRIPVILSGLVSLAAASVLYGLDRAAVDHCKAGHKASGDAHAKALQKLNLDPILSTIIDLQDGAGAALAVSHVRAAVACHNEMAESDQVAAQPLLN